MDGHRRRPSNMSQMCRLCLTEDAITLPIFDEDESTTQSQIPLPFRIMACVSVEVTQGDGLPSVICEKCLNHVNSWHEFKQVCDVSQATLKEWQNNCREIITTGDKKSLFQDIYIKQEPLDEEQEDEEVMEIFDQDVEEQYMVDYIKQEVDSFGEEEEEDERQDCCSVESVHEDSSDPLHVPESCTPVPLLGKEFRNDEVEIIPIPQAGDVSHLRITDIKTESNSAEAVDEVTVTPTPSEGRLLRSVLQGKTRASSYPRTSSGSQKGLRESHAVKPYHCQICGKSFAYNYLLRRHAKVHVAEKNTCKFCRKGFPTQNALVQHVQLWNADRTVSKPYSCDLCNETFSCRTQYLMHADGSDGRNCVANNDHIVTEDGSYKCEECLEDFPSVMLLRLHMRKEHLHFSCHKCNKVFSNGVSLSNHLRSHSSNIMRHYCEKCPMSFTTPDVLKKHEKSHAKEEAAIAAMATVAAAEGWSEPPTDAGDAVDADPDAVTAAAADAPADAAAATDATPAGDTTPADTSADAADVADVSASAEYSVIPDALEPPTETQLPLYVPVKQEPPDSPEVVNVSPASAPAPVPGAATATACVGGTHVCQICGEEFPTMASLRFHLKGVHMHYQCHRCPKVYSSGVALSNHLRSHSSVTTSGRKHKCLVCLKSFSSVDYLMKHKKTHEQPLQEQDPLNTSMENELETAAEFANNNEERDSVALAKRTCSLCNAVLASPSALERHMTTHNKDKVFTCKICNASMNYASSLQKHYRVMHGEVVELKSIQKNPVYRVKDPENVKNSENVSSLAEGDSSEEMLIPVESFTRSGRRILTFKRTYQAAAVAALTEPPQVHAPFECKICHRTFQYRSFLLKHSKVHEKQMQNVQSTVTCPVCLKTFPDSKTLNNHKGVHTRFKHFGCSICGKSFNGLNAWRKHERMHQKGYIYSCKLCGKKFISKAELHNHKKMHIKLKIYTCSVCKNSYHSSSALGKHKRRHGHYTASAEETDLSDVEIVEPFNTPESKPPVKVSVLKQSVAGSNVVRNATSRQIHPKSMSHFPSGKRRPFCSLCNKLFSNVKALRRHKLMHDRMAKPLSMDGFASQPPIPETSENMCLTCNRAFPDHTSLVRHKGWHTRRFNFPATTPPAQPPPPPPPPEPSPLNMCFVKLEPGSVDSNQCSVCFCTFSTFSALESHMRSHMDASRTHPSPEKSAAKGPEEERGSVLNSPRRLACKICKKPFESKKALITHIGWHSRGSHSLKPLLSTSRASKAQAQGRAQGAQARLSVSTERVSCDICHKLFSSALMLSKHKKLHTRKLMSSIKVKSVMIPESVMEQEGNYTCPVCFRVFKFVKYLNLHMRLHTGEKKFKCNMCNQAYHRSGSLWKHKRTHHAFKVFCCHICQKRFGLKTQLTKHMETHTVPNMHPSVISRTYTVYACSFCEKTFAKVEKLRQHERIHRA